MSDFASMQDGELEWWRAHLPEKRERILGLYGMRYLPWFFDDFLDLGTVASFGCGPLPEALIADKVDYFYGIDTLNQRYFDAHLAGPFAQRLPFPYDLTTAADGIEDSSCDRVLALNALNHMPGPERATLSRDAYRLLRPGGALLLWTELEADDDLHVPIGPGGLTQQLLQVGFRSDHAWLPPAAEQLARESIPGFGLRGRADQYIVEDPIDGPAFITRMLKPASAT